MRRSMYENRKSFDAARQLRETFVDRKMTRVEEMRWEWPKAMVEVGTCEAVMYSSDKWKRIGDLIDYKHNAEAKQRVCVCQDFIRDYHSGKPLSLTEFDIQLPSRMPDAVAELANILGLQVQFYDDDGESSGEYHQVNIARAKLGAAKYPRTGETFLLIYTPSQLCAIITGEELAVERDGITG